MDLSKLIGQRIRLFRLMQGMKQQEFANVIATSAGYISEIEAGKKTPGGELLSNLGRVFSFNTNWLLNGEGWTVSPTSQPVAINWFERLFINQEIKKIIILCYKGEFYDGQNREINNGFLIYTNDGVLCVGGMAFRTNTTSGTAAYLDVLREIKQRNIPTYKINIEFEEAKDLDKKNLSTIFEQVGSQIDVYEEMRFYKPDIYPTKGQKQESHVRQVSDSEELEILELLKKVSPETKREFLEMLKAHAKFKNGLDKIT